MKREIGRHNYNYITTTLLMMIYVHLEQSDAASLMIQSINIFLFNSLAYLMGCRSDWLDAQVACLVMCRWFIQVNVNES